MKHKFVDQASPDYRKSPTVWSHKVFESYFIKTKKWFKCTGTNRSGEYCTIHISNDRWKKLSDLEKNEIYAHEHEYPNLDLYLNLDLYFQQEDLHNDNENASINYQDISNIEKRLIKLVGKKNISFNCATCGLFNDLIREAIKTGQNNPLCPINRLYKPQSRLTFTKKFVTSSAFVFQNAITQIIPFKYVGVSIDAGKIIRVPYLDVIISNAISNKKPVVLETISNFSGTEKAYSDAIDNIIHEVEKLGFIVSGFVGDNLRVQWAAFNNAVNRYEKLLNVSCGCHSLNLGIQDTRLGNQVFDEHCHKIENYVHIFISKPIVSALGLACPSICPTRWTNMADICLWIVRHSKLIIKFVVKNAKKIDVITNYLHLILDVLFKSSHVLLLSLISFKDLSLILELTYYMISSIFFGSEGGEENEQNLGVH